MIPKTIHYCWLGGPKSELVKHCIESWNICMSDYIINEWNETNIDFHECLYIEKAYNAKKYAFVSDFVRFKVIYEYGGIYFDTDVELLKTIEPLLSTNLLGRECFNKLVGTGLIMAFEPKNKFIKDCLDWFYTETSKRYKGIGKINKWLPNQFVNDYLIKKGLKEEDIIQDIDNIRIYSSDYFCGIDCFTKEKFITKNTYSIHHYTASWIK